MKWSNGQPNLRNRFRSDLLKGTFVLDRIEEAIQVEKWEKEFCDIFLLLKCSFLNYCHRELLLIDLESRPNGWERKREREIKTHTGERISPPRKHCLENVQQWVLSIYLSSIWFSIHSIDGFEFLAQWMHAWPVMNRSINQEKEIDSHKRARSFKRKSVQAYHRSQVCRVEIAFWNCSHHKEREIEIDREGDGHR